MGFQLPIAPSPIESSHIRHSYLPSMSDRTSWNYHWVVVSNMFYFYPYLGKWSNLTNMFQLSWNHQLDQLPRNSAHGSVPFSVGWTSHAARHMSKAKSTTSSKSSSRLVRNRTVELVSRTTGPPDQDFSGQKWSKWGYQCCLDEHQQGTFYGAKMAKIRRLRIRACFLKWWYPQNTPKWSFLVGKPMVVGYQHFRNPSYIWCPPPQSPPFLRVCIYDQGGYHMCRYKYEQVI